MYGGSVGNSYNLLNNNDCYTTSSSSIVSSAPTTPLIYNSSNYDLISQQQGSNPNTSGNQMGSGSTSYDLLGGSSGASILDYSGISAGLTGQLYQNYSQKMSTPTSTSNLLSQNMDNNSNDGVLSVRMSPSASCSSSSTAMLQNQNQSQQTANSSSANNFMSYDTQSLDQQRKTIDDQLKQLDGELLSKVSELTFIQQQHIQLQQQQNMNLKSKNAFLLTSSDMRASSLSLSGRNQKPGNLSNSQLTSTNSMQALPGRDLNGNSSFYDDDIIINEQEVFY